MAKKTYSEKLKDPRWQKKRLKIFERDDWKCKMCNDQETELHVDHKEYNGEPWEAPDESLQTLCKHCHQLITDWRDMRNQSEDVPQIDSLIRTLDNTGQDALFLIKFDTGGFGFLEFKHGRYDAITFKKDSEFLKRCVQFIQNG